MLTPLKRARVLFGSTTTRAHHYQADQFIKSPHIYGFSPYACLVTLGAWCPARSWVTTVAGGWALDGARVPPRPPADTLECGHGGRGTWMDSSRFWARSLPGFYMNGQPLSSKSPMQALLVSKSPYKAREQKPSRILQILWGNLTE